MPKKVNSTYIFSMYNDKYEKSIFEFIMEARRVDTKSEEFEDIVYDVSRRQVSSSLVKVLKSSHIVLAISPSNLSKSLKVFSANDVKGDKQLKVWIDCSNIISLDKGKYICHNVDMLISYLVDAMVTYIYNVKETAITKNSNLTRLGSEAFSKIFCYIMDYLYKTNNMRDMKERISFMSILYYNDCILGKPYNSDGTIAIAKKIANISDREAMSIIVDIKDDSFLNLKFFVEALSKELRLSKLSTEIIVEKWMYIFGSGTVFGLEMFPAFSALITDAYVGAYINNQKSIEKVLGGTMVQFAKEILQIGETA